MQDNIVLLKYVLPEEIFRYFELREIEQKDRELHLYLEEQNEIPEGYKREDLESNGFHKETVIKDFPIREKPSLLHVRRRRWLEKSTGKTVSRDWNLVAEGTHYTQGFASFLKGLIGYLPDRHMFP
jgi:transposase